VEELIARFGMSEFIERYPNETSLGQRQRAALVRALLLRPSYLLLDEITSALDPENVAVILEQLEELRSQKIGILMATHLVGFARRSADAIVFLDEGKVLAQGGAELLESPGNDRIKRFLGVMEVAH